MHIVMLAAENDGLPGGKVGGLADVIRDLPRALVRAGHSVTVITPDYGLNQALAGIQEHGALAVDFAGATHAIRQFSLQPDSDYPGLEYRLFAHPLFTQNGTGRIYISDDAGPFATDATRFALFCVVACEFINRGEAGTVDIVHCHDWHTTAYLFLRRFAPRYHSLQAIPAVFSIHNLAMQGVRPLRDQPSSLETWFPGLDYEPAAITDPRYQDCVNLMRTGINLADRIHTVSPTYAREILRPGVEGQVGGEGLEADLQRAHAEGRLVGILNGCDYSVDMPARLHGAGLYREIATTLDSWVGDSPLLPRAHYLALRRLNSLGRERNPPQPLLVSIGRLTPQKVGLLTRPWQSATVMDAVLERLGKGLFILLGNGDTEFEEFFTAQMGSHDNLLFLSGFSAQLADVLYSAGDLFVMPSEFEPCGISQMLAMRAGVPCLVHAVGGLNDTVRDKINGFSFSGDNYEQILDGLFASLDEALRLFQDDPEVWGELRQAAAETRFEWASAVSSYLDSLYAPVLA